MHAVGHQGESEEVRLFSKLKPAIRKRYWRFSSRCDGMASVDGCHDRYSREAFRVSCLDDSLGWCRGQRLVGKVVSDQDCCDRC